MVQDTVISRPGTGAVTRKLDTRTRVVLATAGLAAIAVNAGAAWCYWAVTSQPQAVPVAPAAVELTLRAHSDYSRPLAAGQTGNLTITLANDQAYPIAIDQVLREDIAAIADDRHRENGCDPTGVTLSKVAFVVDWSVPKNTIGAFTIPDGLRMAADAPAACRDATFILSIRVAGLSRPPAAG
jgi:hypothetical protein